MIPRWLRFLERLLLRGDDREFLGGDLSEDYLRRRGDGGAWRAGSRYALDLLLASRRGQGVARRFWEDLRYAVRALRGRRVYAIACSLTLAFGLGATIAIYTVAEAVLLTPLPYEAPDRLLFISSSFPGSTAGGDQLSYLDIKEIEARNETLEVVAAYHTGRALQMRGGSSEPERVRANIVSPRYLEVLGARAARGRLLNAGDDRAPGAHPVTVVSHQFWIRRLAADPDIIGRTLTLSDVPLTVVGVLAPGFQDVSAEEGYSFDSDVFIPVMMMPAFGGARLLTEPAARNFWAIARLKGDVAIERAGADVARIGELLQVERPGSNRGFTFHGERLDRHLSRDIREPILLLLAGSVFVLLVALANVTNLMLGRASARGREMGLRHAIGARRGQLVSLALAESVVLATLGGILGVLLAIGGARAFRQLVPGELSPRLAAASLDSGVLLFAALLTVAVALTLGVFSAVRLAALAGSAPLADGSRGATGTSGARTRRMLLVAEVAIAVIVIIGAQLLVLSLEKLRSADLGFRTERLLTMEMDLRGGRYPDPAALARFGQTLVGVLGATPGVESALLWGPARPGRNTWVTFPGREDTPVTAERMMTWRHTVTPGALRSLGIPLRAGREFTAHDTLERPAVVIISETLAATLWPGADPLGKRLKYRTDVAEAPLLTVVGVAADAKHRGRVASLRYPARDLYVPQAQRPDRTIVAVVRTVGEPETAAGAVRTAIRGLDPDLPLFNSGTMAQFLTEEEAETRFAAVLMTTYGSLALALSALGIYGVLNYHVALRRREMAVRLALGATRRDLIRMVVAEGLRPAALGIGAGLLGAATVSHVVASLLFGVGPRDPATFATVAAVLAVVALAAAVLPARTASRVQPIDALRAD